MVVRDPFPRSLAVVRFVPSQGTYDPATGIWNVGTLASGARTTLRVVVRVRAVGWQVNTATASGAEFDPDLSNNTSRAAVLGLMSSGMLSKRFFLSGV